MTQFSSNSYLGINTTSNEVILDFSPNIQQFVSTKGNMLPSAVYGMRDIEGHLTNSKNYLMVIPAILSLLLICLHAVYLGN
jgi:hypothetical protein